MIADWSYALFEYYVAASVLLLSMLGMGTTLRVGEFLGVARAPRGVLLVAVIQVLVGPLWALAVAWLLGLPRGVTMGLLLVAALPGGAYSNLLTYLGRGNTPLSISATAICTAACVVTTPLVLATFGSEIVPAHVRMPVERVVVEIVGWLLAPLAAGMTLRRWLPSSYTWLGQWCVRLSLVLLAVLVVGSLAAGRLQVVGYGWRPALAVVLLAIGWLWTTYGLAALTRLSEADSFTIAVEVVVRNGNLGLLLVASLFPAGKDRVPGIGGDVLFVVLLYSAVGLLVAGVEVYARRYRVGLLYGRMRAY
jgi:BASS family bile acid:Na+ symporter